KTITPNKKKMGYKVFQMLLTLRSWKVLTREIKIKCGTKNQKTTIMKINRNISTTDLLTIFISISTLDQDKKWSLEECVNYAMENNISIKQTALDTDLADQDLINAKGNFLPNLNASASQDWNFGTITNQRTGNQLAADTRGNRFG